MIKDFTKKKYVHIANKNLEAKDGTTIIVPFSFWHILEKKTHWGVVKKKSQKS